MANYDAISEETLAEALKLVGEGKSLKSACEIVGVSYYNANRRINDSDTLRQLYARARQDYMNSRVESLGRLEEETANEIKGLTDLRQASAMVQLARLKADNIKWEAERILRHTYGQQVQVDHGGAVSFTITGLDTKPPHTDGK